MAEMRRGQRRFVAAIGLAAVVGCSGHQGPAGQPGQPGQPEPGPCVVTINPAGGAHRVSELTMGCHSDPGYAHQSRGLSAEMLVGNAFEQVWFVPDCCPKI